MTLPPVKYCNRTTPLVAAPTDHSSVSPSGSNASDDRSYVRGVFGSTVTVASWAVGRRCTVTLTVAVAVLFVLSVTV